MKRKGNLSFSYYKGTLIKFVFNRHTLMAVSLFYQAQPATPDGLPPLPENDKISFSAIYSQYGAVMKGYERGAFFQLQVYERVTFSVKMVYKCVWG